MNVITWPSTFGYTIFCDDIRSEIRGKFTYVGIYASELIALGKPPVVLPKLALAITYFERPGESDQPVELHVYLPGDPDDKPTVRAPIPVEQMRAERSPESPLPGKTEARLTGHVYLEFAPLALKQEGAIRVRAYRGDDEIRLGSLRVKFQPPQPDAPKP